MPHKLLKGNRRDIIDANVKTLRNKGMSEAQCVHLAMKVARKGTGKSIAKKVAKHDSLMPYGKS